MKNKYAEMLSKVDNTPRNKQDSILIVDSMNTFIRSFTMINHSNPEGHHIGGLTGFLKSIGYAIKILDPTKVVLVFDGAGGSNNKRNLYPEYKTNRNKNRMTNYSIFNNKEDERESINNQMARLIQYLQCLPVSIICVDGIEADDTMGYLTHKLEQYEPTKEVIIMSADQDFLQLVSDKVKVYSPIKKKIYTPKNILEEYKVSSINYINYKILMGDTSDNLPGISGLGPKKVLKLFPELSSTIPTNLDEMLVKSTEKVTENPLYSRILEQCKQLDINRQLMDLRTIPLSDGNIEQIQTDFKNTFELNNHMFMQMYSNDHLNNSIPNTPNWLNTVFGSLNNY